MDSLAAKRSCTDHAHCFRHKLQKRGGKKREWLMHTPSFFASLLGGKEAPLFGAFCLFGNDFADARHDIVDEHIGAFIGLAVLNRLKQVGIFSILQIEQC